MCLWIGELGGVCSRCDFDGLLAGEGDEFWLVEWLERENVR